jgi:fatty-acyl-CoA synthase
LLAVARAAKRSLRAPASFLTLAPPTPALVRDLAAINIRVTQAWGPAEVHAPALLTDWHGDWDALPDQAQAAMIAREGVRAPFLAPFALLDPGTGREVAADGVSEGEVALAGELLSPGYWNDPVATANAFSSGGFRTGDLAVRHTDGTLEFRELAQGLVAVGGTDVTYAAIAQALTRHPAVAHSAIEPGPEFGAVAFVDLRPDATATEVELAAHCRTSLGLPADPCQVRLGPLPRSTTGRIARLRLRALAGS